MPIRSVRIANRSGQTTNSLIKSSKSNNKPCYRLAGDTIQLRIIVQPNASNDEIVGKYGDNIKIRLTAKPVDGAANKQLIIYLAKCFQIKKNQIKIRKGLSSRIKLLELSGVKDIPDNFC